MEAGYLNLISNVQYLNTVSVQRQCPQLAHQLVSIEMQNLPHQVISEILALHVVDGFSCNYSCHDYVCRFSKWNLNLCLSEIRSNRFRGQLVKLSTCRRPWRHCRNTMVKTRALIGGCGGVSWLPWISTPALCPLYGVQCRLKRDH